MEKYQKLKQNQIKELNKLITDPQSSGLEIRRAQAILLLDQGNDPGSITGYGRRQCFNIRRAYYDKGLIGIEDKRKNNRQTLLNKKQRQEIIEILKTKTPKDKGFQAEYWTTAVLAYFIEKRYRIKYKSKTSYYLLFKDCKFTYHKPGRVYEKHNEQETLKWRKINENKVKQACAESDTVILCEDEMILSTQTTFQKIWLKAGEYPKIEVSNTKKNRSIYGFLNIKTGQEHAFKTQWQNMYITAEVLSKIRKLYPKQKILLFWDGPGWHRGSKVKEFLKNDGKIEVVYFPRYSPEENPQEHIWKEGRNKVTHNRFIEDIDIATDEFINYLNMTPFNYSLLGFGAI